MTPEAAGMIGAILGASVTGLVTIVNTYFKEYFQRQRETEKEAISGLSELHDALGELHQKITHLNLYLLRSKQKEFMDIDLPKAPVFKKLAKIEYNLEIFAPELLSNYNHLVARTSLYNLEWQQCLKPNVFDVSRLQKTVDLGDSIKLDITKFSSQLIRHIKKKYYADNKSVVWNDYPLRV